MTVYRKQANRVENLRAALDCAERGWSVFPCMPGGKKPLIKDWPNQATTDEQQIRKWWNKWPDANIGVATGERSGVLAVDHDTYKPDALPLEEVEARLGPLENTTRTMRTGRGGMDYLFRYPATGERFGNRAGKLAPGLDVRGEGGYIIAPPSRTTSRYEWLDRRPLADPPEWLLQALRGDSRGVAGSGNTALPRSAGAGVPDRGDAPIPEGTRDDTLFQIGCKLRAQGYSEGAILDALVEINRSRCTPPLPDAQLRQKARQAARYAPGNAAPKVTQRVLAMIDYLASVERPVKGMGGATGWSIYRAGLVMLRRYGQEHPEGVTLSIDVRTWALMAGTTHTSVRRFIGRSPLVRKLRHGSGRRSGMVLFVTPSLRAAPKGHQAFHSTTRGVSIENEPNRSGTPSALLRTLERLRWGPGRIGKSRAAILHTMVECDGPLSRAEIAARLGREKPESLRAPLRWLVEAGLLERASHGVYSAPADLETRVENARELGREPEADRLQMQRHDRERDAYRRRGEVRPDRARSEGELARGREGRLKRREVEKLVAQGMAREFAHAAVYRDSDPLVEADGYVSELVRSVEAGRPPPQKGPDGIYHHTPACACRLCEEAI